MDLENRMLSERSLSPKITYYEISFICNVQKRQIYGDKRQLRGYLEREGEGGGVMGC